MCIYPLQYGLVQKSKLKTFRALSFFFQDHHFQPISHIQHKSKPSDESSFLNCLTVKPLNTRCLKNLISFEMHRAISICAFYQAVLDTRFFLKWTLGMRRSCMIRDSCAAGLRFTRPKGQVQPGHFLSLIHQVLCKSIRVNACHEANAMWIFACYWYPAGTNARLIGRGLVPSK